MAHSGERLTLPHVGSSWRKRTMGGGRGTPVMTHCGHSAAYFAVMQNRRGRDLVGRPGLEAVRDPSPIKPRRQTG